MLIVTQTNHSTIYYDKNTNMIQKSSPKELFLNEARILSDLQGLKGIPEISLKENTIMMKKYQTIRIGKLNLIQIRDYIYQLGSILSNIHQKGYVHLDITPNNILKDQNQLILIDFGLSKKCYENHFYGCGTPGYIAPEIFHDDQTYSSSDMFSLGIIFGQMLEVYLPELPLQNIHSKNNCKSTINMIFQKLEMILLKKNQPWNEILYLAADLLFQLIQPNRKNRITANQLLKHPFIVAPDYQFWEYTYESIQCQLLKTKMASYTKQKGIVQFYRG